MISNIEVSYRLTSPMFLNIWTIDGDGEKIGSVHSQCELGSDSEPELLFEPAKSHNRLSKQRAETIEEIVLLVQGQCDALAEMES